MCWKDLAYSSIKGSLHLSLSALWQTSTPAMFSNDSVMSFLKHRAMEQLVEAVANLVVGVIIIYLHERFMTFLGDHWTSRWYFTMM